MGKVVSWITTEKAQDKFNELVQWARDEHFADYDAKPDSVPYRVKNILENLSEMIVWDGTRMDYAKGFLQGHYTAKKPAVKVEEIVPF